MASKHFSVASSQSQHTPPPLSVLPGNADPSTGSSTVHCPSAEAALTLAGMQVFKLCSFTISPQSSLLHGRVCYPELCNICRTEPPCKPHYYRIKHSCIHTQTAPHSSKATCAGLCLHHSRCHAVEVGGEDVNLKERLHKQEHFQAFFELADENKITQARTNTETNLSEQGQHHQLLSPLSNGES